jgi:hypothetical protein
VGVVYSRSARARERAGWVAGKLKGNFRVGISAPPLFPSGQKDRWKARLGLHSAYAGHHFPVLIVLH